MNGEVGWFIGADHESADWTEKWAGSLGAERSARVDGGMSVSGWSVGPMRVVGKRPK